MDGMRLVDERLEVWFDAEGRLTSICSESVGWTLAEPVHGWSLRFGWSDHDSVYAYASRTASVVQLDERQIAVRVDKLRLSNGEEMDIEAEVRWCVVDGLLQGRLRVLRHGVELQPSALAFPDLCLPYEAGSDWVVPDDIGALEHNPGGGRDVSHVRIRRRMHMQFTAWLNQGNGLYMDSRDVDGWAKSLVLDVHRQVARLRIEHMLPQASDGELHLPDYPVSIRSFAGGWYEAARIYSPWARNQQWAQRGKEQRSGDDVARVACWLWNRGRIENVVEPTKRVADRLGLPIALDWYWWHKNPYDSNYPDYFPPRDGRGPFREAVSELQRHGVAVQVYTNGMSWDQEDPDWDSQGRPSTVVRHDGTYHGIVYNTWMNRRLMHLCGAAASWRDKALETARNVADLGVDGLYMDQIGVAGGVWPCFNEAHGHLPGGGPYAAQGFRQLFSLVRSETPGLFLSSEGVHEVYQDLLDCCITLQTSWERVRGAARSAAATPIPLFQAVYHGRSVVFGNYAHIDGITPYDELWPAEGRPDPGQEQAWTSICPDQFALEIARTVAFGCQPTVTNLTCKHLEDPALAAEIDFFLHLSRFYHAHREWLLWGDMLAPGRLECADCEVRCISRSIFTKPETIEPFDVLRPAVLHSVWRSPAGGAGLVLINYTRQDQHVVFRCDASSELAPPDAVVLPARTAQFTPLRGRAPDVSRAPVQPGMFRQSPS